MHADIQIAYRSTMTIILWYDCCVVVAGSSTFRHIINIILWYDCCVVVAGSSTFCRIINIILRDDCCVGVAGSSIDARFYQNIACRSTRTMVEQLKRGSMIPRATGYTHIEFGQLGCSAYGDIHKIRRGIGGHGDGIF